MLKKPMQFNVCQQKRRWLEKRGTLNIVTGAHEVVEEVWVTGPCNVPLFKDTERESGICRSCAAGWDHPHNQILKDA